MLKVKPSVIFIIAIHILGLISANYALKLPFSVFGVIPVFDLIYPIIFVATLVMTWLYGADLAKAAVYRTIPFPFIVTFIMNYDPNSIIFVGQLALAASCAYTIGQLTAITVYDKMRDVGVWPFPLATALISGTIYDTIVFYGVFSLGAVAVGNSWAEMCMNGIFIKLITCVTFVIPACGIIRLVIYAVERYSNQYKML